LLICSYKVAVDYETRHSDTRLLKDAEGIYDKDITFRKWVAMHGGVYVPITKKTQPNPYLSYIKNRDITTTSGEKLTLMNPAYSLRQFMTEFPGTYGEHGKITSLKYINPVNAPDKWEQKALEKFKKEKNPEPIKEKVISEDGVEKLRFIKPLVTVKSCLKCHAYQNYKEGDIRGAISISVPTKRYVDDLKSVVEFMRHRHLMAFLIGSILFSVAYLYFLKLKMREDRLNSEVKNVYNIFNKGNIVLFRWSNDDEWSIEYVSENVKAILGYSQDELMRGCVRYGSLIHKDSIEKVSQEVEIYSHSTNDNFTHEPYKVVRKDSKVIWVSDTTKAIKDRNGNILYYEGHIQDITELRNQQIELENVKERLQFAVDGSSDGLWDWNILTSKFYTSARFDEIVGIEAPIDDFAEFRSLVHREDISKINRLIMKNLRGEIDNFVVDLRMIKPDGSQVWIHDRAKTVYDKDGKAIRISGFITDITRQKELEENLQHLVDEQMQENLKQRELLQQQSKLAEMGEMVGAIAHQWRQPLNEIAIRTQNLEYFYEDGDVDKAFIDKFVQDNMKTINFMSKTIDDFRGFFRVDKQKERFDVKKSIEATISLLSAQLKDHNITLEIEGESFEIDGYHSEFQQVILNIITNAKDALSQNGVKDADIKIVLQDKKIMIRDNAGGVDEKLLDRIFEPYFTTKEQGKGTGMGLYMSKLIIENNMDGKLEVENIKDGAQFSIIF
jgi:PAS domain S-box-containing protein